MASAFTWIWEAEMAAVRTVGRAREPDRLFIASDANPSLLLETAWKAGRKPARGGISNLICIAEPLDVLAAELGAVADRVTVILPWGSLLRSVAAPDVDSLRSIADLHSIAALRSIADLCLPEATIEIVFSYDSERDARERAPLGVSVLDERHILTTLPRLYEQAGLPIALVERLSQKELAKRERPYTQTVKILPAMITPDKTVAVFLRMFFSVSPRVWARRCWSQVRI